LKLFLFLFLNQIENYFKQIKEVKMKSFIKKYKVLRLILIAFGLFFIEQNLAFSTNCDPCNGNCVFHGPAAGQYGFRVTDPNYFHESGTIYLDLDRICYYDIRFQIRECTCPNGTTTWEIFIDKIEFYGDCQFYNQNEKIRAIQSAIKTLLRHTPLYFVPESELYRFWNGWDVMIDMNACWTWNASTSALEPCPFFDCCRTKYVIRPANGTFEIVDKFNINQPSPTTCGGVVGGSCFFACDANDLPPGSLGTDGSVVCSGFNDPCPNTPWDASPAYFNDFPSQRTDVAYFGKKVRIQDPDLGGTYYGKVKTKECNGQRLIYFESVQLPTDADLPTDIIQGVFIRLIRAALYNSRGYFQELLNPDNPDAVYNVTVILPSCWQRMNYLLVPCPETECCSLDFTIDFNEYDYNKELEQNPNPLMVYIHYYEVTDCNLNPSSKSCSNNCFEVCLLLNYPAAFIGLLPYSPSPRRGDDSWGEDNSLRGNMKFEIFPVPANEALKIFADFERGGELILKINNLFGNELFSQQYTIKDKKAVLEVQTKHLPQGVYTLSIIFNGEVISRKLFVILR